MQFLIEMFLFVTEIKTYTKKLIQILYKSPTQRLSVFHNSVFCLNHMLYKYYCKPIKEPVRQFV